MIRVLHSVSNMDKAGIETMLMNYYREIDRTRIQFDFLVNKKKPGAYDEEIRALGGHIYQSPGLRPDQYPAYVRFVGEVLRNDPSIRILHAHNEGMAEYALRAAEKAGLQARIAHAHNTKIIRDYKWPLKVFCKFFIPYTATEYFACGRDAGIYYFGQKRWQARGHTMHNAIDPSRFVFSSEKRQSMRAQLGVSDRFVVGHIGRFNFQKNHTRLLDIFASLTRIRPDAVLLLIGEGELEAQTRGKARQLGIEERIQFLGVRGDIPELCMAMDVFVLPSLFEGLPVVGIEAQASGLPCVFSAEVTDEVVLLGSAVRLPLASSDAQWAEAIVSSAEKTGDRAAAIECVRQAGYDIHIETEKLTAFYLQLAGETDTEKRGG